VFGLAIIVRFLYNETVTTGYFPLHDSLTYQTIALNILQEHCYCYFPHLPTVDRAPLWPMMIATIYGILGSHDHMVRFFLCLVGSGTCVLVYCFARDMFGVRIGTIAGLAAAIYPFLFIYDGWLYSESLYIFLLFAFCYALYRLQRTPSRTLMIVSGILLGLVSLTRPNGLLILGLFIVWAAVIGLAKMQPWRIIVQSIVTISLISLVLIAPWTLRNYVVSHSLVAIATGDGKVLVGAYNDAVADPNYQQGQYLGTWLKPEEVVPALVQQFPQNCSGSCEVERDGAYKTTALQWIHNNLGKMPLLLGIHAADMWQITSTEADFPFNRFPDRNSSKLTIAMMEIFAPIVFALAALGLIVTIRRWHELLFIYFLIVLTFAQCLALYGFARFRAPIEPMLLILASGAVWWLLTLVSKRNTTAQAEAVV
jgi:4-amino-4-deoxy-L-arabinose transferase-like glycosyltransferase